MCLLSDLKYLNLNIESAELQDLKNCMSLKFAKILVGASFYLLSILGRFVGLLHVMF